jgi:hypothetical protein
VVETAELLTLDAMEWPPTLWAVLTAREHLTRPELNGHLKHLRSSLRKRWPRVEWFVQVEFQRRGALHANLLVKGVPVDELRELYGAVTALWCRRVDAIAGPFEAMHRGGQWAGAIEDAGGTVRYLSKMLAHGLKAEQAPPIGWRGHRTSQTRGYLVRPASEMRAEAKRSLRVKRALRRGVAGDLVELELELEDAIEWELVQVRELAGVIEPRQVVA